MPRTRTDLVARALGLLGVIQVGQEPSAEDRELVDSYIDGKVAELARREVFYVQDPNSIDDEAFLPLARMLANAAGPEFGQAYDGDVDAREELRLRDIDRRPNVYETLRPLSF